MTIVYFLSYALTSTNTFSMLTRTIPTKAKNIRSCVDITWCSNRLQEQRAQLVMHRQQIKERNNILIERLTEQNKTIDDINELNRPMIELEYFWSENKITSLAQKFMEEEQKIRK